MQDLPMFASRCVYCGSWLRACLTKLDGAGVSSRFPSVRRGSFGDAFLFRVIQRLHRFLPRAGGYMRLCGVYTHVSLCTLFLCSFFQGTLCDISIPAASQGSCDLLPAVLPRSPLFPFSPLPSPLSPFCRLQHCFN